MARTVGVRFKPVERVYYFDPGELELNVGDLVVAEGPRGLEIGRVVIAPQQVIESELTEPLKSLLRKAQPEDMEQKEQWKEKEAAAFQTFKDKVTEHKLPMKGIKAEYNFDGSHLTFYFSAEGRVDFRELVKDLARTFKTRIELRQVGPKDLAKLLGQGGQGLVGRCGRAVCCITFLISFPETSVNMAKVQGLAPNPEELAGLCGRLRCCIRYEYLAYFDAQKELPQIGAVIETSLGSGKVVGLNQQSFTAKIALESGGVIEVPMRHSEERGRSNCQTIGCNTCSFVQRASYLHSQGLNTIPRSVHGDFAY